MKPGTVLLLGLLLLLGSMPLLHARPQLFPQKQIASLEEQLKRYTQIAAANEWTSFEAGTCLRLGDSGVYVLKLRHNLLLTADLAAADQSHVFDLPLQEAVRKFQQRNGIMPDGIVGQQTLEALNVRPEERARQIELNLNRWKDFDTMAVMPSILVNIPAYMLHLFDDASKPVWQTRVVVGMARRGYNTKVMEGIITYLVVNPTWTVPNSIIRNEIIPIMKRDPGYLARNHMRVFRQGAAVSTHSINWHAADPVSNNFTIVQKPGTWNALGKIKFIFPNPYSMYLHDTPAKTLFAQQNRAYSHGCIRVQHPDTLAQYLLNPDWQNMKDMSRIIRSSTPEKTVFLPNPIAIRIGYYTCWVDEAGTLQFRKDIYGLDEQIMVN